jgi:uncharacterized membrane protein YqjE
MIDVERISQSFGIFGAVRRFAESGLGILQNRLELLAVEFKEEKSRLIAVAAWAGAMVLLGFLSLVAIMFTLTLIFWEQRIAVMGGFCGLFVIGTLVAFFLMRSKLKTPPFAESITQLKKDREWLQQK